jgi:aminobenzoyl-glutamate utilization protein B
VNYLREHMPSNIRIHCVIREGGTAPNVVPEYARIWYYVRAKDREQVDEMTRRVTLCAKGAAIATETRLRVRRLTACYNRLRNRALAEAILANLVLARAPRVTADDRERSEAALGKEPEFATKVEKDIGEEAHFATSDEDNVSWLVPLGCFGVTCGPKNARGHNREYTAQGNLPFAHKGMLKAAQVFAMTAWDLATDSGLLRKVGAEFKKGTKGFRYDPLVPARQRPPIADE